MGQGLLGSVGNRERDVFRAEFGRDGRRLTVKLNGRTLPLRAHHFDVAPPDAVTPSRAQRFHAGFLGGEARRVAFKAAGFSFAIKDFANGENAMKKAVAEPLNALADARHFGDVHSGAKNHKSIVNCKFVIGNFEFTHARELSVFTRTVSCSGNTVRRSTRTRPSSTRATMGGMLARRRALSSSALRSIWVSAIRRVGKTAEGAAPPPITDSPSMNSSLRADFGWADLTSETTFSARHSISYFDSRSMRSTGTASWSRLT